MKVEDHGFVLSTGRKLNANGGILGLGEDLTLSEGYDSDIEIEKGGEMYGDEKPLTAAERAEIADYMIELWHKWAAVKPKLVDNQG